MSCKIYGKEKVKFIYTVTDEHNAMTPNTYSWRISDQYPDGSDNTLTSNNNDTNEITKVFESKGTKQVVASIEFDDGWGNKYTHQDTIEVTTHEYLPPVLDFTWNPENPIINKDVTFTQNHIDTRDNNTHYGNIVKVQVDIYNDQALEFDNLSKTDTFTYKFTEKQNTIPIRLIANYNTGWEIKSIDKVKTLTMSNIPPDIDITDNENRKCIPEYIWTAVGNDPDGEDNNITYKWFLYKKVDDEYTILDNHTGNDYSYVFQFEGDYRIKLVGTDQDGGVSEKISEFTIVFEDCSDGGSGNTNVVIERRYFDWE